MVKTVNKIKPAAGKNTLIFLSGFLWIAVGIMLLHFSYTWLKVSAPSAFRFTVPGVAAALIIHHFGFLKIVDRNLGRISLMEGNPCIFSFMPWKSYILVAIMITMGMLLRHSAIPKPYLSVVYTAIGLSLILSSVRYLRVLIRRFRSSHGRY